MAVAGARGALPGAARSRWWWPPAWRRPGRAPGWSGSTTTPDRTAPCSPPTIPGCTGRTRSTPTIERTPKKATSTPGTRPRRCGSTSRTGLRRTTTTRWSRTPPPRSGATGGCWCTTPTRAPHRSQATLAELFELPREAVRVVAEHVGGGFGSKGYAKAAVVLAALAARQVDRPVRLALTRQQLFGPVGYRTPTIQRVRLARRHRRAAHRDLPRRDQPELDHPGVRRADRGLHPQHVRRAAPAHHAPAGPPRRADAVLDARPR